MVAWLDVKESEGESEKNRKKVEFLERETDDGEERKRLKPTKGSRLSKHSANEWRWAMVANNSEVSDLFLCA